MGFLEPQPGNGPRLTRTFHTTSTVARDGPTSASLRSGDSLSIGEATQQQEDQGVEKFSQPFDNLMKALVQSCHAIEGEP